MKNNNIYFGGETKKNKSLIAKRIIITIIIIWGITVSYFIAFIIGYNKGKKIVDLNSEISYLKEELFDVTFNDNYRRMLNYNNDDEETLKNLVMVKSLEASINKYKDVKNIPEEKTIPTKELLNYIIIHTNKYNLDLFETAAQIATESDFIVNARSNKDCRGLMQISKGALNEYNNFNNKNFKWDDICIPSINIEVGCWYMRWLKDECNKNDNDTLYHYNAGPYRVEKNIKESVNYVAKINSLKESFMNDLTFTYLQKID